MSPSTRQERLSAVETVLRWDAHKDTVSLFTASPAVRRKLERAGLSPVRRSVRRGREIGWFFSFPYRNLRWGARTRKTGPVPRGFGASRVRQGLSEDITATGGA